MSAKARPFRGSRQKLVRAKEHIASIEASIAEWLAGKWCTCTLIQGADGPPKLQMAIHGAPRKYEETLGDALHNLRSALDLTAVEVVRIHGGNERGVKFPFSDTAAELDQAIKSANFHRASPAAQSLVRALQPYNGGNKLLRGLHDLDVENKHRRIAPNAMNPTTQAIKVEMVNGKPEVSLDPNTRPSVILSFPVDGPLAGQPVVPELQNMLTLVTQIVDDLEAISP